MGKERGRSRPSGSQVRHGGKPYERRQVNSTFPHPQPAVEKDEKSEGPPSEATKTPIPLNHEVFKEALTKLCRLEHESLSCTYPLNPEKNHIPDYPQETKRPMALSTVLDKLNNSVYLDPWEIIEETWAILDNLLLYNHKNSEVYQYFTKLAKVAEAELTLVMLGLGYCCAKKYSFDPHPLHCFGKKQEEKCSIMEDATYHLYDDKYAICETCFNMKKNKKVVTLHINYDSPSETDARYPLDGSGIVPLPILASQPRHIFVRKEEFVTKKNNELEPEHKVQCNRCQRWFHNICVLHVETVKSNPFICSSCQGIPLQPSFRAALLPQSELSVFIETKVRNKLAVMRTSSVNQFEVTIRLTSSTEKVFEVKPRMRSRFVKKGDLAAAFPYKAKSICAFQNIDGVDVLFFVMYVQEYDSDCPAPNTGRVYISYLDSVNFFQPKHLRTMVYHEIILGYLQYVESLGFHAAHIWACPPNEGEYYILHAHPPDQKVPCVKRLIEWYNKLLKKGMDDGIIKAHQNLWDQFKEGGFRSAAHLPYFEGDFWPLWLEEEIHKEEAENKKIKRKCKKRKGHMTSPDLNERMRTTMEQYQDRFLVVHLRFDRVSKPIHNPNPDVSSTLLGADSAGRDALIAFAKENNYEFSSLRRAKFTTQAILLHITEEIESRSSSQSLPPSTSTSASTTASISNSSMDNKARQTEIEMNLIATALKEFLGEAYAKRLTHAQLCKDDSCKRYDGKCFQTKEILAHVQNCSDLRNCLQCQKLLSFCYYHSGICREGEKCGVPYCLKLKRHRHSTQERSFPPSPPPDCEGRVETFPVSFLTEATAPLEPTKVERLYNLLKKSLIPNVKERKVIDWLRGRPELLPFVRKRSFLEIEKDIQDATIDLSYPKSVKEGQ